MITLREFVVALKETFISIARNACCRKRVDASESIWHKTVEFVANMAQLILKLNKIKREEEKETSHWKKQ